MLRVLALIIALLFLAPAWATPLRPADGGSSEAGLLRWINNYRAKPDPEAVPPMIRSLSQHGALRDPDAAGVYVGFLAGVLGSNPAKARSLVTKTLPLPFENQWIVIRAVAYSGLPEWKNLMRGLAPRLPERQVMIERYLTGKLPTLDQVALERKRPTTMEKVRSYFTAEDSPDGQTPIRSQVTFDSNPDLIDTLWGVYFATRNEAPIARIIALLH